MRRWAVRAVLLVATGCGRIGFEGTGGVGTGDATAGDGADAATIACPTGAFMAFVQQTGLDSTDEDWEPTLSPDGLHVVFESQRNVKRQLFYSSRTSLDGVFDPAMLLGPPINLAGEDSYAPFWAGDGHLEYEHQVVAGGTRHVASVTVDTSAAIPVFSAPIEIDTDPIGAQIVATSNQLERWLTEESGVSPNTKHTLVYQRRASTTAPWSDQALPSTFNAAGLGNNDGWAAYDETRHELWWERDRPGSAAIVSATRSAEGAAFDAAVTSHPELGSAGDPSLSPDGLTIVFGSPDPVAGFSTMGANDIYTATRSCL